MYTVMRQLVGWEKGITYTIRTFRCSCECMCTCVYVYKLPMPRLVVRMIVNVFLYKLKIKVDASLKQNSPKTRVMHAVYCKSHSVFFLNFIIFSHVY